MEEAQQSSYRSRATSVLGRNCFDVFGGASMKALFCATVNRSLVSILTLALMAQLSPLVASAKTPAVLPVSGDVLISGGISSRGAPTASAEFYSVSRNQFIKTGAMHVARSALQAQTVGITPETTVPQTFVFGGSKALVKSTGLSLSQNANDALIIEKYIESRGAFTIYKAHLVKMRSQFESVPFPGNFPAEDLDGHILVIGGMSKGIITAFGEAVDPTNIEDITGELNSPRLFATGTLLNDGTILVTGGIIDQAGDVTDSAELFDPVSFDYVALSSTMTTARAGHTATLLNDGNVLITGGLSGPGGSLKAVASAEIYNPTTQVFSSVGNLYDNRTFHTASLLNDGTVLVAGGANGNALVAISRGLKISFTSGGPVNNAEIYNPLSHSFACVGGSVGGPCQPSMNSQRLFDTATTLANGAVLIAGGFGISAKGAFQAQNTAELFQGGQFVAIGNMIHARAWHAATVLP